MRCCGEDFDATDRDAVLKHFSTTPFLKNQRPFALCMKHDSKWRKTCGHCKDARALNAVDKSLRSSGLMLSWL